METKCDQSRLSTVLPIPGPATPVCHRNDVHTARMDLIYNTVRKSMHYGETIIRVVNWKRLGTRNDAPNGELDFILKSTCCAFAAHSVPPNGLGVFGLSLRMKRRLSHRSILAPAA